MFQTITVILIGIALAAVIVCRLVRTFRRPKSCCGDCPLSAQCSKPTRECDKSVHHTNNCCK